MKIENEVTGEIGEIKENYVGVRLHVGNAILDSFAVDIEGKEIVTMLDVMAKTLLNIENTFEAYMKLIADLGLDIQQPYKKHWTPKIGEDYFYIDPNGEICPDSIHKTGHHKKKKKRAENYNTLPTRGLAEKSVNLSKLGRLILLWQYANDCIFVPDWRDRNQSRYHIIYISMYSELRINVDCTIIQDKAYFKTKEQAESFVKMYEKEIKEIMEVI